MKTANTKNSNASQICPYIYLKLKAAGSARHSLLQKGERKAAVLTRYEHSDSRNALSLMMNVSTEDKGASSVNLKIISQSVSEKRLLGCHVGPGLPIQNLLMREGVGVWEGVMQRSPEK